MMQPLWRPFSNQLNQLLDAAPTRPTVTAGYMPRGEYDTMYNEARRLDPEAAKRIGSPDKSPFTRGRAAVVQYPDVETQQWVERNASKFGIRIDPDYPWLLRPMGDRFQGANAERPASQADLLEVAVGSLFYGGGHAESR